MNRGVSLKWDDYQASISSGFSSLRQDQELFDVTLVTDDEKQVLAHKVVLAASSSFFRKLLRNSTNKHPLLYLTDVNSVELTYLLDYIYNGQVTVPDMQLNSFMIASQKLKVDGLIENKSANHDSKPKSKASLSSHQSADESNFAMCLYGNNQQDTLAIPTTSVATISPSTKSSKPKPAIKKEDSKELDFLSLHNSKDKILPIANTEVRNNTTVFSFKDMDLVDKKLEEFSEKFNGVYRCKICLKTAANRTNHHFHIETHMDGLFFQCDQCERTTKTRNAMRKHYGFYHKHAPFNFNLSSAVEMN